MKKPFSRVGGKSKLSKTIVNLFPDNYENMVYIEPFFGGGSIYFEKKPSIKEIINDRDEDVYILMKGFKKYDGEDISNKLNKMKLSGDNFKRILHYNPNNEKEKFIKNLYLIKNSFFGMGKSFNPSGRNKAEYSNIKFNDMYKDRLKNTTILNKDYKIVLKKYDSSNSLFYLDPPYESSDKLYKHFNIDYIEMNKILEKLKGRFLLSINYNTDFIKLFKNFKYKVLETKYADPSNGGIVRLKKEFLFYNF